MPRIITLLFAFGDNTPVQAMDEYVRKTALDGQLALSGPSPRSDGAALPVRGDLAHIRLAGIHFVPHYAVPMAHFAGPHGAIVLAGNSADADVVATLAPGVRFDVLDMAGGWAWGEQPGGKDAVGGVVGYVSLEQLTVAEI